jgi:hypothetical protein
VGYLSMLLIWLSMLLIWPSIFFCFLCCPIMCLYDVTVLEYCWLQERAYKCRTLCNMWVICPCYSSDCSYFRVVMSITISTYIRWSVGLYLQLFVGRLCFIYVVCVCLCIVVYNTYWVVFFVLFVSVLRTLCCQFLWLSILDFIFGFL